MSLAMRLRTSPSSYKVDIEQLAADRGLKVFSASLPKGVSGMLAKRPEFGSKSGFVIFTEKTEPAVRQRFTAAHEIGHFDLHRDLIGDELKDNYLLRSDRLSNRVEFEANKYAANLLMPMDRIREAMKEGITSPRDLADAFGVSEIAMAIQLGMPT